ncbi:RsmB/NOP family class I SAM-dependent RNA methyltransferase [Amorphus orientalis]|uniref:16S rRNA (Cytosine967-C5)-methyltransferase n=1 Tax=Amorphus orientalis TaxID=649198 RepID=A0AAE3VT04_9HYPH|nr:RsmB/NOP family class I SAM-dependent RNA methyltransferase [Amorphus orientalis]MDQ0317662.1 16S rRNA (cytosine967-C5)-methyltransferase [Amorphus orientalis]
MRIGGRIQAAIEVLETVETQHRPIAEVLKDWGNAHRFAGSGDRAAIGNLVFDAVRWRSSSAWLMDQETARAIVLGTLAYRWGWNLETLADFMAGDEHGPEPPTAVERTLLSNASLDKAPAHIRADVPEWIEPQLRATFKEHWVDEAAALAARAPIDVRANSLKAGRDKVLKALDQFGAKATPWSPLGVRIGAGSDFDRSANVTNEPGYQKGWFEVQDEASQLAVLLAGAEPGEQVLDLCAGAGGKTLALAAEMNNRGQVHAYDRDKTRLKSIFDRLRRAGTRNVQVHSADSDLKGLLGKMDRVFVDAPCTGSGVWRRRPDTKWRLTPAALEARMMEQSQVLDEGARHVRPGGRLIYVTCSVFADENSGRIDSFLRRHPSFAPLPVERIKGEALNAVPARTVPNGLLLSPATTKTDGFFVCVMERAG